LNGLEIFDELGRNIVLKDPKM